MEEIVVVILVLVAVWVFIVGFLCYMFPVVGISLITLIALYLILSRVFPGLLHGKTVYSGRIRTLSKEDFKFYRGHSRHWNLTEGIRVYRYDEDVYFQKSWNPHYVIEISTGKALPMRTSWLFEELFFGKIFYILENSDPITDLEKVEQYLKNHVGEFKGASSFKEYLKQVQKEAKETYREAKSNAIETDNQKMQTVIREYREKNHKES